MTIKLIKDSILGNIAFSKFEALFFENQLFNRLHYITQNSMAFKVFPSDKTSRFSHGTGVMHIASSMFKSALANTHNATLKNYMIEKSDIIEHHILDSIDDLGMNGAKIQSMMSVSGKKTNINYKILLEKLDVILGTEFIRHCSFYDKLFLSEKYFCTYLIMLTSVRIIGLLHDIGHLPFSHLSEHALVQLLGDIDNKEALGENLSKNEILIRDIMKELTSDKNDKIHEVIGDKLALIIIEQIRHKTNETGDFIKEEEKCFLLLLCSIIGKMIVDVKNKEKRSFGCLNSLVSGDFDADRLDFVIRDGLSSGLIDKTGDFERIIKMYCLGSFTKKGKKEFRFMPSIQSINDVQEVLKDRYRIYKYLVNHHKVKRTDYLLQTSLTCLMHENLQNEEYDRIGLSLNSITDLIVIANTILKTEITDWSKLEKICYQFSQATENWAMNILNKKFVDFLINLNITNKKGMRKKDNFINVRYDKGFLKDILNEIFTSTKNFNSLWKREHEYNSFMDELKRDVFGKYDKKAIDWINNKENILPNWKFKCQDDFLFSKFIKEIFVKKQCDIEKRFYEENNVVLIVEQDFSVGIEDIKLIDLKNQKKIYDFNEISSTRDYLESDKKKSIGFQVIYRSKNNIDNDVVKSKLKVYISHLMEGSKEKKGIVKKKGDKNV